MYEDSPIVQEVRERAMQLDARFGHDLRRYFEHLQAEHPERLWRPAPAPVSGPAADAARDQRPAA